MQPFLSEYTSLGEIGHGGFARVFKVRHNRLEYIRAIKVLNDAITDEESPKYKNFLRQCKILLSLGNGNHPNIVHIYKPDLKDNQAFVEMDFVDGIDIAHYLKENGFFLSISEIIRMVSEISSALAYCHEDIYKYCINPDKDKLQCDPIDGSKWLIDEDTKNRLINDYKVIHNDIHSGNIMRREDGSFILLDFGLAIKGDEVVNRGSRHENGALEYMPPEKWEDESIISEQSDIYSFGVVMFEYLTGRVPFVCEGTSESAKCKLYDNIKNTITLPSIAGLRKSNYEKKFPGKKYINDVPEWLEYAITKCLEKNPAKRFRNGKELKEFIESHKENDLLCNDEIVVALKNTIDNNLSAITALKDEIAVDKDTIENNHSTIAALKDEIAVDKTTIASLKNKIKKLNYRLKVYLLFVIPCTIFCMALYIVNTKSINGNKRDIDTIKVNQTSQINGLNEKIKMLEMTIEQKEEELVEYKKQVTTLSDSQNLQSESNAEELQAARNTISHMQRELDNVKKERDLLREKINQ